LVNFLPTFHPLPMLLVLKVWSNSTMISSIPVLFFVGRLYCCSYCLLIKVSLGCLIPVGDMCL
jgi:hypothetical protein